MKIAVTGPNGQLGSELVSQGWCIPLYGRLITAEFWEEYKIISPDVIINCAAKTGVDDCEGNIFETVDTNATYIGGILNSFQGYFVQISTDYVFDGKAGPYCPTDPPNPISIYGWSKLGGELVTRRHKGPWLIIRTTVLFSESENNFVAKIIRQLAQGKQVTLYQSGMTGTPTYVPALAEEILRIVEEGYTGVAHIAGRKTMSRLEFARLAAYTFGFDPDDIIPSDSITVPYPAPRPYRGGLICDHSERKPIRSHSAAQGLEELARLYKKGEIWK